MLKEYSDLFLNLMIEHEPILAIMYVQRNISHGGKKFEKIPVWRGKVGIVHMLTNPAWRESLAYYLSRMAGGGCDDSYALKKYPAHGEKFGIALMLF